MNKFVITMLILLFGAMCYSAGNAVANPWQNILGKSNNDSNPSLKTTKVETEEGTYRIFAYQSYTGSGLTAIKIK